MDTVVGHMAAVVDTVAAVHTVVDRTVAAAAYKVLAVGMPYTAPVRSEPALP